MSANVIKVRFNSMQILDYGLEDFHKTLQTQQLLVEQRRRNEIGNTALMVEHKPIITLGARQDANKLLIGRDKLAEKGIDVVEIRRGGGTTAHNPGQIVFYPILNLQQLRLGVSEYIRTLEQIGIELLEQLDVKSERRKGFPGLWVNDKKIASIGVRISRQITHHGMAINIRNDLSIFDYIIPCGLDDVKMTSVLNETGKKLPMQEVKERLNTLLVEHFEKTEDRRQKTEKIRRLPDWLRRPMPSAGEYSRTSEIVNALGLETICMSANCPNRGQCWAKGTATVLILGNICTRGCKFCSVAKGKPKPIDSTEPTRIAELVKNLGLQYLVITSVDRDDLPDGGASHFQDCINEVRRQYPDTKYEILTPDFRDCQNEAIEILAEAQPFVFAHNVETVPSLYTEARAGGDYQRSLNLLKLAKESYDGIPTKSSIMLGLGETEDEVERVLKDLRSVGCDRLTIGQYLKPSKDSLEVVEYITPEKFDWWKQKAIELGFKWIISAPFARSSYFAEMPSTQSAIMTLPFTGE
ncbi:MAG: lipoyl synthase [Sedimentisphaerales bacterium]|nr:lipoyl synthase [Sedimentisphaerales bacterium]